VVNLREYILTEKEREALRLWFEEGKKANAFYLLLERARKNVPRLRDDLQQLEMFVRSFEKQKKRFGCRAYIYCLEKTEKVTVE